MALRCLVHIVYQVCEEKFSRKTRFQSFNMQIARAMLFGDFAALLSSILRGWSFCLDYRLMIVPSITATCTVYGLQTFLGLTRKTWGHFYWRDARSISKLSIRKQLNCNACCPLDNIYQKKLSISKHWYVFGRRISMIASWEIVQESSLWISVKIFN